MTGKEKRGTMAKKIQDEPIEVNTILVDPESLVIRSILPGILTVVKCHIRGGRKTWREDVTEIINPDGSKLNKAKVNSLTVSPEEVLIADALRSKVKRYVKKLSVETAIGLIVPSHKKQELAQTLMACRSMVEKHNENAKTLDLAFHYCLFNVEGNSAGPIAAVTEQLHGILQQVNEAVKSDDAKILEKATKRQLGEYRNAAEVLAAPTEQRIAIIAKIRADLTRAAIAEAKSFSTLLPEDASLAVSDRVQAIRKDAVAWVKASKQGEEAYETALNAVDIDGISSMQAALVRAAAMADTKATEETAVAAGGGMVTLDFNDEPEVNIGSEVSVKLDLFKNGEPGQGEPEAGTMAV
jgi:hypothetical protein